MIKSNHKKYYENIDIARFVCAFFVVAIHTQFLRPVSETAHTILMTVCGIAVPVFFACSGFFLFARLSFRDGKLEKTKANLHAVFAYEKRIIIAYVFWSVIYFGINLLSVLKNNGSVSALIVTTVRDFFLNGTQSHLWYIVCLVYAVPLLYGLLRVIRVNHLVWILPLLYAAGQVIEGYYWLEFPGIDAILALKNTLGYVFQVPFRAIVFVGIGVYLSQRQMPLRTSHCAALAAVAYCLGTAEVLFVRHRYCSEINVRYTMLTYAMTFFLMSALVRSAGEVPHREKICIFLRKTSSFIYFVHPAIQFVLHILLPQVYDSAVLFFPVTSVLSFVAAAVTVKLSDRVKILKYIY